MQCNEPIFSVSQSLLQVQEVKWRPKVFKGPAIYIMIQFKTCLPPSHHSTSSTQDAGCYESASADPHHWRHHVWDSPPESVDLYLLYLLLSLLNRNDSAKGGECPILKQGNPNGEATMFQVKYKVIDVPASFPY